MSGGCHRLRQLERPQQPREQVGEVRTQLHAAQRCEHASAHKLSGEHQQSEPCFEGRGKAKAEEKRRQEASRGSSSCRKSSGTEEGRDVVAEDQHKFDAKPLDVKKPGVSPPVIAPGYDFDKVTAKIGDVVLTPGIKLSWAFVWVISLFVLNIMAMAISYLFLKGVGIWGINIPVGWGFAIVNFVWWIGIGHAGTLISAILLLFKQSWRTSINRFAEAMTLFAVMCAGIFPLIHTGRPWLACYWLFPYPNSMGVWPQFRSPLIWDVFEIGRAH